MKCYVSGFVIGVSCKTRYSINFSLYKAFVGVTIVAKVYKTIFVYLVNRKLFLSCKHQLGENGHAVFKKNKLGRRGERI